MTDTSTEATLEEYRAAKESLGTAVTEALDNHTAKMAFNVLSVYDLPRGVQSYLTHARTLFEVSIIWAVANGWVDVTEKGRENVEVREDGDESFSLPTEGGNIVPLHPSQGQYL